jgi:hypothetical protein
MKVLEEKLLECEKLMIKTNDRKYQKQLEDICKEFRKTLIRLEESRRKIKEGM